MELSKAVDGLSYEISRAEDSLDEAQSILSDLSNLKDALDGDFEKIFNIMSYYELYWVGENPEIDRRNLEDIALLAPILKKNYFNLQKEFKKHKI